MAPLTPVWDVLVWVILPIWVLSGFADYLCHRAERMERSTGARESLFHWAMLGEAAAALAAVTWLRVDAAVFAFAIACLVAHEITSHFDARYARATREISVTELQIHALLEVIPLTALLLLAILHWQQAEALVGLGPAHADWQIALKAAPSLVAVGLAAAAFLLFCVLPYAEELWRGLRAGKQGRLPKVRRENRDSPSARSLDG